MIHTLWKNGAVAWDMERFRCRYRRGSAAKRGLQFEVLENRRLLSVLDVTSLSDNGSGSLRAAVAMAQSGDTIQFAPQLANETITLTSGPIAINQSLAILGPAGGQAAIDGGSSSRVFTITGSSVTLTGLTVEYGYAAGSGGGILDLAQNLTLNNDQFLNNQAIGNSTSAVGGGALDVVGGDVVITSSYFAGNHVQGLAGVGNASGGEADGGAINSSGGNLTIEQSDFVSNIAQGAAGAPGGRSTAGGAGGAGVGGALYYGTSPVGGVGSVVINGTRFQSNSVFGGLGGFGQNGGGARGAGVAIVAGSSTGLIASLSGDQFDSNTATSGGGGDEGRLPYAGAGGTAIGGGVFFDADNSIGASFSTSSTYFSGNMTSGGRGGNGGINTIGGSAEGGAIAEQAFNSVQATFQLDADRFVSNQAVGGATGLNNPLGGGGSAQGGAVWENAGQASESSFLILGGVFKANTAQGGTGAAGYNGIYGGPGGNASGGAVDVSASQSARGSFVVNSSVFTGNASLGGIGGAGGDRIRPAPGGVGGAGTGGAVDADALNAASPVFTISNDVISGNKATGGAGGAGGNHLMGGVGLTGGPGGSGAGGGIALHSLFASAVSMTVSATSFNNNEASGGIGGAGGKSPEGELGGTGGASFGGGLNLLDLAAGVNSQTVTLDTDPFYGNIAAGGAGGQGGNSTGHVGGHGGHGANGFGGGLHVQIGGTLAILHGTINNCGALPGSGGRGGEGSSSRGSDGSQGTSAGGGVCLTVAGYATKTSDTVIAYNHAQMDPDIFGKFNT
jgi:hypothetical protein